MSVISKNIRRRFSTNQDGVAAIEFAIIAPILGLILIAGLDLGLVLKQRFNLDSAVNSATSYALVNRKRVGSAEGGALASELAKFIAGEAQAGTDIEVDVNNGPDAKISGNQMTTAGTSTQANLCWCPKLQESEISWGVAKSCGTSCEDFGQAGKFVSIKLSLPYTPLLFDFGLADTIRTASMVRTE